MATPFSDIYDRAIFKIRDGKLASLNMADQEFILKRFLKTAIADFAEHCLVDINDFDDENDCFNVDLDNEVQELLALGIAQNWLDTQMRDKEMLRNKMSTKDYQYFSPANLVREANTMREQFRKEYEHRLIRYTYAHGNLAMDET